MSNNNNDLEQVLRGTKDPHLGADLLELGIAKVVASEPATVNLTYPYPAASVAVEATDTIKQGARQAGLGEVNVNIDISIQRRVVQVGVERLPEVRNVIAVASAKGGVGKSTIAANLALALHAEGASVGLLDADIYGPSQPLMLGGGRALVDEQDRLLPHQRHGLQVLSMGHLVDPDQAVIWRAPMIVKALGQLLRDTAWHDLDFLVLDMPPGTGDIQLSVAQGFPVTGAVIVTTPQELAVADAIRGINMFAKLNIPVLGHVTNMASFHCPNCKSTHPLFGENSPSLLADASSVELAALPVDPTLGAAASAGTPAMVAAPDSEIAARFKGLAGKVGALLTHRKVDRGASMPKVVAG